MSRISHSRSATGDEIAAFISLLATGAVGPALVALPINLVGGKLATAAVRWFKRLRQTDDLSRLVKAAADSVVPLDRDEIGNLRALLEKKQTWSALADGRLNEKLRELIDQVAGCLPPRDGRTEEDAREAAWGIVRGLLEFAVYDLQPEIFQKVVLARLQQMTNKAGALDEALFRIHKDLYQLVDDVQDLFSGVMDRLQPGRADLNEVRIYLNTLISWLNTDPWPEDPQLGGPRLTPAAIERKLRISAVGPAFEQEADQLAQQCVRLVVLGGPGSGKTWLAMRTARICAEEALTALENASLDDVELPLYTTCSRLVGAPGGIRRAAVSSAIEWLGDMGGERITQALVLLFSERDTRTLLVIDSLDEASDPGLARDRLRQAGSLRPPWRVMLTSRPSSWNKQLTIEEDNQDHRVGELQPLRYPTDVEPVIRRWFAGNPERGQALAVQIAMRPSLQQAATVPLILAFYCILGGQQPLPEFRHKLYEQVINRMLRGPWRSSKDPPPDMDACRQALRAWAWQGAKKNHPVSGIGQWDDDIPTKPAQLSPAGQIAVDHIAAPRGGPGFDTDETLRRFVHRSIREHLVAEQIARLPAHQAVQELLPHLWYDPDWEYTAPEAIALHPERDEVLEALLSSTSGPEEDPGYLFVIDTVGSGRRFLSRIAIESGEDVWPADLAKVIGQARVEMARLGVVDELSGGTGWLTSNRQVREALLGHLTRCRRGCVASELASTLIQLKPTAAEKYRARQALLRVLKLRIGNGETEDLVGTLARLEPTPDDKQKARQALLGRLAARRVGGIEAQDLAGALARLEPTPDDKQKAQQALLGLLARRTGTREAQDLAGALARLEPTPDDKQKARQILLSRLAARRVSNRAVEDLVALARLDPTQEDKRQVRQALRRLLTGETWDRGDRELAGALAQLHPTAEDRRKVRETLLYWLVADGTSGKGVARLASILAQLDPTAEQKCLAQQSLMACISRAAAEYVGVMAQLASPVDDLARALVQLDPTADDKRLARYSVGRLLSNKTHPWTAVQRIEILSQLDLTADQKRFVLQALLGLLPRETDHWRARRLLSILTQFDPTAEDKRLARQALLERLDGETGWPAAWLFAALDPPEGERSKARRALLKRLAREVNGQVVGWLLQLNPTADDKHEARQILLQQLASEVDSQLSDSLAGRWLVSIPPLRKRIRRSKRCSRYWLASLTTSNSVGSCAHWRSLT
jgi:hypothetical protein